MEKVTTKKILNSKSENRKLFMLTAYDFPFAKVLDDAGVDMVLIGDSLGNVALGYKNTRPVTMENMIHHTKAVARAVRAALLVADIPYRSVSVKNAKRLIKSGAQAVKIEGVEGVRTVVKAGIPVMGHLGYLPQTMTKPKIQRSVKLLKQAKWLEEAGVFAITLEMVEPQLARKITESVNVPTIGIGSGSHCDGQVLVTSDLVGLSDWTPGFVKPKLNLKRIIRRAVKDWMRRVERTN
jgi:3-methyl-2-oxobutanoate hydroxymethyltransferase